MKFIIVSFIFALCISYAYSQTCTQPRTYPTLKQCDSAWSGTTLGSSTTICASGCLVCSVASALTGLGKTISGSTPTCSTLNTYLRNNGGYSGNLFIWGSVSGWGLTYEGQPTVISTIKTAVCANKIVILNVNNGGHWVLAKGVDASGNFIVMDPGYSKTTYTAAEVSRAGVYKV